MKHLLGIVIGIALFGLGCNPKTPSPCDNVVCLRTFKCEEGICKCPAETYNIGKECVTKASNTYYSISDCACYDTLVLRMPLTIDTNALMDAKFQFSFKTLFSVEAHTIHRYKQQKEGDTFWIFGADLPRCPINGRNVFPEIFGKVSPSRDTISTTIYWHIDNATIVDTCRKIFVR